MFTLPKKAKCHCRCLTIEFQQLIELYPLSELIAYAGLSTCSAELTREPQLLALYPEALIVMSTNRDLCFLYR